MYGHSWLFDVVYRFLICLQLLNTEAPDLYIRQNHVPNAYTLAINGKKPFIVVHTSLVELLTPRELQVLLFTLNKLIG
jgi:Zn-dependent protease with chaperone function